MRLLIIILLIQSTKSQWNTEPGDPDVAPYAPHPLCYFTGPKELTCNLADLHIPGNFNSSVLYSNTSRIYPFVNNLILDCPTSANRTYCNTIGPNATALSSKMWMWDMTLIGFQAEGGGRAPIDVLVAELDSLLHLHVHYSKIGTLDRHFLRRFDALRELDIRNNDISAIELNALEPLLELSKLKLGGNAMQAFDWSVLQPVAKKLRLLEVDAQTPPLQTLRRSGPLFSLNITTLSLNRNRLPSVPKDILDSLDIGQYGDVTFDIRQNPVCPDKADCSCCALKGLANWFANHSANPASRWNNPAGGKKWTMTVQATCGTNWNAGRPDAVKEFTLSNPLLPSSYEPCH
ncbi:uncharacterized protein LOC129591432 isoform X2 [Paramacrobiotus metropolitanus]|nr:uncharacterized protein LOC129591432 isoform X2 [Paramacrobiotus metropolitanus]XP_055343057.1 uncharacterized protein LOC129591432 isoform X2 [Paramacrobiotus metropolitanus]XP_055343058.1 uncharacterized protein LOC129591432 isoform X2 [Paramacrobiotus metropolitanus]XP_055343059.1 uncharacterized protein LOC129591432 isoform X2 [Paramacrobiotus metropolitanus]XP_055343060.1 uncharacterized protein LOC129591432 isoform X2 [Paramacrobiotus metropolitanus]